MSSEVSPKEKRREEEEQLQREVQQKLQEIKTNPNRIARNNLRRLAHYKNELLIMSLEDRVEEAGGPEKAPNEVQKALSECQAIRDQHLQLEGVAKPSPLEMLWSIFRLAAFFLWFFLSMVAFFFLTPLRWLHPLLRRLGVPNNYLPLDFMQWFYTAGLMAVAGVHSTAEGVEEFRATKGSTIVFFSHASNCDPLILLAKSPVVTKLLPFKKGPFHLREDTGIPITPALIFGAYELWPRNRFFTATGKATIRFCPSFVPDPKQSRKEQIRECRKVFLKGLADHPPEDASAPLDGIARLLNVLAVLSVFLFSYTFTQFLAGLAAAIMAHLGWTLGQFLFSVTLSILALSGLMMVTG